MTANIIKSPDHVDEYANFVSIRVSSADFGLAFGMIDGTTVEIHTTVYLAPQQAKALILALEPMIKQYEAAFGEISVMPKNTFAPGSLATN